MVMIVRGYKRAGLRRAIIFQDRIEVPDALRASHDDAIAVAMKDACERLGSDPHMIEVECLDEPDPNLRYFRFGSDPSMMTLPIGIEVQG